MSCPGFPVPDVGMRGAAGPALLGSQGLCANQLNPQNGVTVAPAAWVVIMCGSNFWKGSRRGQCCPCVESHPGSFGRDIPDICPLTCIWQVILTLTLALSQTGAFARLQVSEAGTWCVDPVSGEGAPPGTNSSAQCE